MKYTMDYYAMLQVPRDASEEVIRSAYKALAKKYHPDTNNGDPYTTRIMAWINEAYSVLSTPSLKREYDVYWDFAHISRDTQKPQYAGGTTRATTTSEHSTYYAQARPANNQQYTSNANSYSSGNQSEANKTASKGEKRGYAIVGAGIALIIGIFILVVSVNSAPKNGASTQPVNSTFVESTPEPDIPTPAAPVVPQSITITGEKTTNIGKTITLKANISPQNAEDTSVTWNSSNKNVATVNVYGMVSAKTPGKVTITATTHNGISTQYEITVNPNPVTISNGIIKQASGEALAPVKVNAPSSDSVYVYFKSNTNSRNDFSIFVKAGSSFEIDAPLDTYTVYYAQGKTWYGTQYRFGVGTGYYKADSTFRFYFDGLYYNGTELTLYKVAYGNLSTETISESEFPG